VPSACIRYQCGSGSLPRQVELLVETDRAGRRHVTDPTFGVAAIRYNLTSWGGLGLVCGATAGATGGSGFVWVPGRRLPHGRRLGPLRTRGRRVYGLWAGRATSVRRLKGIGRILAPGASTLLAWAEGPLSQDTLDTLAAGPDSQQVVLSFNPTQHGAILEVA
jgi:hypothetical protein